MKRTPLHHRRRAAERSDAARRPRRSAAATLLLAAVFVLGGEEGAAAQTGKGAVPPDLKAVVKGFQDWLLGFASGLALLALTVAGIFYLFSAGSPTQVERAKLIVRATVIGYSLMVLAPLVLSALQGIVG